MNKAKQIKKIKEALADAEYIVIGGGAGLSAAAGLDMDGERFQEKFRDFIEKYGIRDLYSGGFYPFQTREEKWAFWAKHILQNRYEMEGSDLYRQLYGLVKDRPYYVISTNVDSLFIKSGFPDDRFLRCRATTVIFSVESHAMKNFIITRNRSGRWLPMSMTAGYLLS